MCSVPRKSRFTGLGWDFCRMGGALTIDMMAAWWALAGVVGRRSAGVVEGCFGHGSCVEPWCASGLICRDTPGVVAQLRGWLLRIGGIARFVTTAYGGCAAHSGRVAADGGGVPWRRRSLATSFPGRWCSSVLRVDMFRYSGASLLVLILRCIKRSRFRPPTRSRWCSPAWMT